MPDMSVWLPILTTLIPLLLPMFPGVRNLFALMPNIFFETIVAIKGGKITWNSVSKDEKRVLLGAQIDTLKAEVAGLASNPELSKSLEAKKDELVAKQIEMNSMAIGDGTLIEWIKKNPLILVAIVGGIIFFVSQKGGCGKVVPKAEVSAAELLK